jgi:phage baseplate assembly protein V
MSQAASEFDRMLGNVVRMGTIAAVNPAHADGPRATVNLGDLTTDWLPFATVRAGQDRTWWAPEPGEQVLVLAPSGDLSQGVIALSVFQDAHPANGDRVTVHRTTYQDGTVVEYDRETHTLAATLGGDGHVNLTTGGATLQMDNGKIRLAIGGSSIELNSSGVTINGSRIDLN